jgi:hypothetical protein
MQTKKAAQKETLAKKLPQKETLQMEKELREKLLKMRSSKQSASSSGGQG